MNSVATTPDVRTALGRLMLLEEHDRAAVAQQLHDGAEQTVAAWQLLAVKLRSATPADPQLIAELDELTTQAARELRDLALALRPAIGEAGNHAAPLEQYLEDWSAATSADVSAQLDGLRERLPDSTGILAFRVLQAVLAATRAPAKISVVAQRPNGRFTLIIEIHSKSTPSEGIIDALERLRQRSALLGGTLEAEANAGHDTTVFLRLPLTDAS